MSPATQEAFRALLRGMLQAGVIESKPQMSVIVRELAAAVPELERRGEVDDATALEGLVADLTADFR